MAAFVSLATCHYCPVASSRRGLVYRDSLSVLSLHLRTPGVRYRPPTPRPACGPCPCRLTRPQFPESTSKPAGGMKRLVLAHLKRLLALSPPRPPGS